MGIGQKVANQVIDITGSLVKRGVNDLYTIGKELTKHSFKTTFKLAKHTTKFSYHMVKMLTKKAREYHTEKQLTKNKVYQKQPIHNYATNVREANLDQFVKQQPVQQKQAQIQQVQPQKQVPQVQQHPKQNRVVYSQEHQKKTGKPMFHERVVHDNELKNVQRFHADMIESGFVTGEKLEEVKKIATLLREERQMLSKNKEYKNSEYSAYYDYVNNSNKGKKIGVKEAVKNGDLKGFQNEYTERMGIIKADITSYYQKIEQTTNLEEKNFWAGRLENFASFHKQVLKNSGLGKEIEGMKENKPALSKTELLEEKLKRIEGLKKGISRNEEIQKKVDGMKPGTKLRNALEGKLGASVMDMDLFFKSDKDKQAYRERRAQQQIEQKKSAGKEMYF